MNRLALLLAFSPIVLGAASGRAEELPRLGVELQINTTTQGRQSAPAIVSDRFSSFVVIWTGEDVTGAKQVFGQRYDVAGARQGGELQISTSPGISNRPQIAATPDGGFAAVWVGQGVRLRLFGPAGVAKGGEIQVSSPGFQSIDAGVAVNDRGEIMVLWTTGGTNGLVFTRRFDLQGQPIEEQQLVGRHLHDPLEHGDRLERLVVALVLVDLVLQPPPHVGRGVRPGPELLPPTRRVVVGHGPLLYLRTYLTELSI